MKLFRTSLALSLMFIIFMVAPWAVYGQTDSNASTSIDSSAADIVTAADLGVNDPVILPDSPWYGLKNFWRGLRIAFTFDKVKKVEKRLQYANERVLEAQKLTQERQDEKTANILAKAIERYTADVVKIQEATENIGANIDDNQRVEKLVEKIAEFDIKRRAVLDKISDNVPENVLLKIMEAKKQSAKSLGKVLERTMSREQIAEKVNAILEQQTDGNLQDMKDLEIVKEWSDNAPAEVRARLAKVENGIIQRFQAKLKNLSVEEQQQLQARLLAAGVDSASLLEVLNDVRTKTELSAAIKNIIQNMEKQAQENFIAKFDSIDSEALRAQLLEGVNDEDFMRNNQEFVERIKQINAEKKEAFKQMNEAQRADLQKRMQMFREEREAIKGIEDKQEQIEARKNLMEDKKEMQQQAIEKQREQKKIIMDNVQQQRQEALQQKVSTTPVSSEPEDGADDEEAEDKNDEENSEHEYNNQNENNSTTTHGTTTTANLVN